MTFHQHTVFIKLESDFTACGSLVELSIPQIVLTQGTITETNTAQSYVAASFSLQATDVALTQKPFTYTNLKQDQSLCDVYDYSYLSAAT